MRLAVHTTPRMPLCLHVRAHLLVRLHSLVLPHNKTHQMLLTRAEAYATFVTPSVTLRHAPAAAGLCAISTPLTKLDGGIRAFCTGVPKLGASTAPSETMLRTHTMTPLEAATTEAVLGVPARHRAVVP